MTKLMLSVVLAAVSVLSLGVQSANASGSAPSGAALTAKARVNNAVSAGYPLDKAAKGVKQFGADTAATLVFDEAGVAPTAGGLVSLEISSKDGIAAAACYLMVFDSAVASDTTEANSQSRMLVPPLIGVTSSNQLKEYQFPKQFHRGLVVLVGGANPTGCRAHIGWTPNGGAD